jgi:hypothetical protein
MVEGFHAATEARVREVLRKKMRRCMAIGFRNKITNSRLFRIPLEIGA